MVVVVWWCGGVVAEHTAGRKKWDDVKIERWRDVIVSIARMEGDGSFIHWYNTVHSCTCKGECGEEGEARDIINSNLAFLKERNLRIKTTL